MSTEETIDFKFTIDWDNPEVPDIPDTFTTFARVRSYQIKYAPAKGEHFTLDNVFQAEADHNGDWHLTDELMKFPGRIVKSSKRVKYIFVEWRKNQDGEWYQSYFPYQFQGWNSMCKCKNGIAKNGEECQECNGKGKFPNPWLLYQLPEIGSLPADQRQILTRGDGYAYISYERQETPIMLRGFGLKREYTTYYMSNIVVYKNEKEWQAANDEYWSESDSSSDTKTMDYLKYIPEDNSWYTDEQNKPGCLREAFLAMTNAGKNNLDALTIIGLGGKAKELADNEEFIKALSDMPF